MPNPVGSCKVGVLYLGLLSPFVHSDSRRSWSMVVPNTIGSNFQPFRDDARDRSPCVVRYIQQ